MYCNAKLLGFLSPCLVICVRFKEVLERRCKQCRIAYSMLVLDQGACFRTGGCVSPSPPAGLTAPAVEFGKGQCDAGGRTFRARCTHYYVPTSPPPLNPLPPFARCAKRNLVFCHYPSQTFLPCKSTGRRKRVLLFGLLPREQPADIQHTSVSFRPVF